MLQIVPGIGAALAARLARRKITTRAQLRAIIDELPRAAQAHVRYDIERSVPAATAADIAAELMARLVFRPPTARRRRRFPTVAVGSVRRLERRTKDIDILVVAPADAGVLASATLRGRSKLSIAETYAAGGRRRSVVVRRAVRGKRARYYAVDLFLATPEEKPFALFHHTGGRAYNIRMRARAKRRGYRLNQYGIFDRAEGARVTGARRIKTERDLARFLGVSYREPEAR